MYVLYNFHPPAAVFSPPPIISVLLITRIFFVLSEKKFEEYLDTRKRKSELPFPWYLTPPVAKFNGLDAFLSISSKMSKTSKLPHQFPPFSVAKPKNLKCVNSR